MTRKRPHPGFIWLILTGVWLLVIAMAPPERTLGGLIRWVFAHASLTQVALLLFAVAAILAILDLLGRHHLFEWMEVMGWVALGLWLVGFLLSTVPAKLSWGVWVDFQEPRTQMTLRILAVGILFVVLTRWVDSNRFTAGAQIVLSVMLLFLNRNTAVIRHPANPIGQAETSAIPLTYSLIFLLALMASLALIYFIVVQRRIALSSSPTDIPRQITS